MADDDIRDLLSSVQDYFVRGGLDEDARYVLGPHAYEGLSKFASLGNFIGPGADVEEMKQASANTMESLRNQDYLSATADAAMIPAAFAMMALPGTAGSVKEGVEEVIQPMYQSTVRDALDRISQEKGTGQQMRAMLEKAGAKPREIDESGLSSLLKNPTVTKSEIEAAIPKNISEEIYQDARFSGVTGPTNYPEPDYTLRGGDNYREVVIKADPQNFAITSPTAREVIPRIIDKPDVAKAFYRVSQANRDNPLMPQVRPRYGEHFLDTPNSLAHIRMDDRTTASGKDTVFIQEIQSDLHQLGRKRGYATRDDVEESLSKIEELSKDVKRLENSLDKKLLETLDVDQLSYKQNMEINNIERGINSYKSMLMEEYNKIGNSSDFGGPLPDLPLKKNWYETSFRRALKDAIDSGSDSLTWAPGQVHIDRYPGDPKREAGLRKFYDEILVKYANKLGKKYGAKVEEDTLDIDGVKLSEAEELSLLEAENEMSREDFVALLRNLDGQTQKVWSLPITAEMMKDLGGKPVSTYKRGGSVVERSNKHEPKAI